MKRKKFLLMLQILNTWAGAVVFVVFYLIIRIVYHTELLSLFSVKLWIFDVVIAILSAWGFYSWYVSIAKPFIGLMNYFEMIWRQGWNDMRSSSERQNPFTNLFNTIQEEMDKNRTELQSYSQQVALRASMIRELKQEYEKKVYDLFTLFDVARELNSTLDAKKISQTMLLTCMGQMGVRFSIVFQLEEYLKYKLTMRDVRGIDVPHMNDFQLDLGSPFIKHLTIAGRGVLLEDLQNNFQADPEFLKLKDLGIVLIVPFVDKKDVRALLAIGPRVTGEKFNQDEIEFLSIMTNLGGLALENAKLYTMAITDGLTKLYVQRYFVLKAEEEVKRSKRYKQPLSILMIDVDDFKKINDTYGHLEGNKILKGIAESLVKGTRETDIPCRYGGEEFAILMPVTDKQSGKIVAERLLKMIGEQEFLIREQIFHVTVSIGEAEYPVDGKTATEVLDCADNMLYKAKTSGKNKVIVA